MTIKELQSEINKLNEEINAYCGDFKTKVRSKNIRVLLGTLKNNVANYRRMLVNEDKK